MKKQTKQTIRLAILSLLMLAVIAGVVALYSRPSKTKAPAPPVVGVAKVVAVSQQPSLQVVGTLAAVHGVVIKAPVAGRVTAIHFTSNQTIKAGQLLVEVNPGSLQAQLAFDRAQLTADKLAYERSSKLVHRAVVSPSQLDKDKAAYEEDKATVAQDKANLNDVMLTAPFAGTLGLRQVQVGQYLTDGDTITSLEQLSPLWVNFSVPSRYLSQVKVGQWVDVSSNAWVGKVFRGKVTAVSSLVASNSDEIALRAELTNSDKKLLPGQLVNVKLLLQQPTDAMVIPTAAVMYSDKGDSVYRVEDGKAVATAIKLGGQSGDGLIVLSGLAVGDTIVVAGGNKIHGNHQPIKGAVIEATAINGQATASATTTPHVPTQKVSPSTIKQSAVTQQASATAQQ